MRTLILCPTQFEAAHLRSVAKTHSAGLHVIGLGTACEQSIRSLAVQSPSPCRVILAGTAGALGSHAQLGHAFIAERVVDEFGVVHGSKLTHELPHLPLCCSKEVVASHSARVELAARTGAAMVDMESGPFVRVAIEMGWHWCVLRGISDDATTEIPAEVIRWVHPDGRTNHFRFAVDMVRKPSRLPAVVTMVRNANAAMRSVATKLNTLVQRMPS